MAGPNILNYGDQARYPTYVWWVPTQIYIENLDSQYKGKVTVTVEATDAHEDVYIDPNSTAHISRSYWGSYIYVANTGGPVMKVWTQ
jgi:hypothetical protein